MVGAKKHRTFDSDTDNEYLWLQVRRIIEHVTYASIAPDIERYSAVHPSGDIGRDQKAKKILDRLECINPKFLPLPLGMLTTNADGTKQFNGLEEAQQATKDRLIEIFDEASAHLHVVNPWAADAEEGLVRLKERSRAKLDEAHSYLRTALWEHYKMGLEFSVGEDPKALDTWSGAYIVALGKPENAAVNLSLATPKGEVPDP